MTYVDERIVEMKFDNKQFEQETARSMSTLDKLKEKLQFKNASTGAEQLQKAVANINFNPIISGIGTIETKMSAISVAGKRVIENLTDWAMSGISKVINKLNPIPQIITGGKSRAQNIEQAKFQLKGLGVAWNDIQEDINYGVQDTAYGLDAAAKVASQLVASQVQLGDEMKHALLGISGVAAMTNSTYDDIGRIYTTVAGNGRLMGEQLLQLSGRGINAAAILAKQLNVTEAEVRDMVSKSKISFDMFSEAMWKAFGEHAKSANETFTGALSNTKAALSRLGADVAAQGFNSIRDILNDIIPKLKALKKGLKPVEDAIIKMVDAVGKLVQAFIKALDINGIVKKISPVLTKAAETITDFALAYEKIFNRKHNDTNDAAFFAEQRGLEQLKEKTDDVTSSMEKLYDITDEQKKMAEGVWRGEYGNGQDRVDALKENYNMVQAYVEKMIELGWDEGKMNEFLKKQQEEHTKSVVEADRAYKKQDFVNNLLKIFNNLKYIANNVFESIKNILSVAFTSFGKAFNGGTVMDGFINLTAHLAEVSDKLKITKDRAEKLRPIFDMAATLLKLLGKGLILAAKGLSTGITKIGELYEKAKESERLKKIRDDIVNVFKTIYDTIIDIYEKLKERGIIDSVLNGLGAIFEFVTKVLSEGVTVFSTIFSSLVSGLGDGVKKVTDGASFLFTTIANGLRGPLRALLGWLEDIIGLISLRNIVRGGALFVIVRFIYTLYSILHNITGIVRGITELGDSIVGFFVGMKRLAKAKVRQMNVETLVTFIKSITSLVWAIAGLAVIMAVIPNANKMAWQAFAMVAIIIAMYGALQIITDKISGGDGDEGKNKNRKVILNIHTQKAQMGLLFAGIASMILAIIKGMKDVYQIMNANDFNSDKFLLSLVIVIGVMAAIIAIAMRMIVTLKEIKEVNGLGKMAIFFVAFAISLKLIISALSTLYSSVSKDGKLGNFAAASGIIIALYAVAFGMIYALSKMKQVNNLGRVSLLLMSYGASMNLIVKAVTSLVKTIDELKNPSAFKKAVMGIMAITALIGGLIVAMLALTKSVNRKTSSDRFIKGGKLLTDKTSDKSGSSSGPLFGIAAVVLSFAFLIKSMVPAINAIMQSYKEMGSSNASSALWGLIRVIGVIGLLIVAIQALSLSDKGSFGQMLSMMGLAAVILAISHAIKVLGDVIKKLSGIDTSKIIAIGTTIGVIVGVLLVLTGVMAKLIGPTGALALLSLAALVMSIGVAVYFAAKGFKYWADSIVYFVESLPSMVDALLKFFDKIRDNKTSILTGVYDTFNIIGAGIIAAFVGASASLITAVPVIVHNLMTALVVAINSLADEIFDLGPDIVDAVDRLGLAILYVWTYAIQTQNDRIVSALKGIFGKAVQEALDIVPKWLRPKKGWGDEFGKTTTTTMVDPDAVKDEAEKIAKKNTQLAYGSYAAAAAEEKARLAKNGDKTDISTGDLFNFDSIKNSKIAQKAASAVGVDLASIDPNKYLKEYSNNLQIQYGNVTAESIDKAIETGDVLAISKAAGYDMSSAQLEGQVDALLNGSGDLTDANVQLGTEVGNAWDNTAEEAQESGELWSSNLANGALAEKQKVVDAAAEIQDDVINKILSYKPKMYNAATELVEGYNKGLNDAEGKEKTYSNVADLVLRTKAALEKEAVINSPSKKFAKLGQFVTLGFAQGILELAGAAEDATESVGKDSVSALRSILDRIFDTTMGGLDTNPVISPVLDLSRLEEGLGNMNTMMDANTSFGLALGAMSGYNRNLAARNAALDISGQTEDTAVVEAVNELRTDLNDIKGMLGNLGFYVDGKQIATAIADPMSSELDKISVRTGRGVRS